jgi:bleomycin hydrolase
MNLKEFEFSQNHLMFWDKLERANFFLEAVIETAERDLDDRTVAYLLDQVSNDGGQWNMFVALVRKHGVVPKSVMPETHSSSNTDRMNQILQRILRRGALQVRSADDDAARRECKHEVLDTVHRVLCMHLGTPPERFTWQWTDKDKQFHRDGELTPQAFADKYVALPLEDYVCLVHDPRESSPRNRTFTVEYLGNVVGAPPVVYLNVDLAVMKKAAMDTIVGGEPVWFGCDVDKMKSNALGIWDARLYDLDSVYGASLELAKADRLVAHDTLMTHAMLFTGVDVLDGNPRKWRVENSWGTEHADQGFWTMNDNWFDEFVFEVAVRREHLTAELQAAAGTEPIVLPAWDPMGALAR